MAAITETQLRSMLAEAGQRGMAPPHVPAFFPGVAQPSLADLEVDAIAGKTVMDIGANIGLRCFQAAQLGAARVVGIDVNPHRVHQARALAEMLNLDVEFHCMDADEQLPDTPTDIVVCSSVLNRSAAPAALLRRLTALTKEQLVIHAAGPDSQEFAGLLNKHDIKPWERRLLRRLPVVLVGRAGPTIRWPESRFALTPEAVRHMLLYHSARFCKVSARPAATPGYHCITATRRHIGHLLVISGISGVGKTAFVERMTDNPDESERILGVRDFAAWPVIEPINYPDLSEPHVQRLCLHNDMSRGLRYPARAVDGDIALQLMLDADRVTCVTLWAPLNVIRDRKRHRMQVAERDHEKRGTVSWLTRLAGRLGLPTGAGKFSGARAARWRAQQEWDQSLLDNAELIHAQYRRWIRFCDRLQVDAHWIVDTSKTFEPINASQFEASLP